MAGAPTYGEMHECKPDVKMLWQHLGSFSITWHALTGCHKKRQLKEGMPWLSLQARRDYHIDVLVEAVVHALGYKNCVLAGHDWCVINDPYINKPCPLVTCGWSSPAAEACKS